MTELENQTTMRKIQIILLLLLTTSLLINGCTASTSNDNDGNQDNGDSDKMMMSNRDPAPDFTYTSLEGEEYTLSELTDKVVYLFFFGANCPHCRDNGPVTENTIYQEFKNTPNFVALGLDTWNTSASEVENFKEVTGISYPLLLNAEESLIDYYGDATAYDRSVVVDGNGDIAYKGTDYVDTDTDEVVNVIKTELGNL